MTDSYHPVMGGLGCRMDDPSRFELADQGKNSLAVVDVQLAVPEIGQCFD